MAYQLEQLYSKETILALYLNKLPFGNAAVGIQAAAFFFFACNAKNLNIQQAVVLIGMIKASTRFNPRRNPELSLKRRNIILQSMVRQGKLLQEVADSLKRLPLNLQYRKLEKTSFAPHFQKEVKQSLGAWYAKDVSRRSHNGLKIYTTLNSCLQESADKG